KQDYKPHNVPYNGTFTSDENGKIEIIIEASNFVDARGGGLIRSLKFGSEQAVSKETNTSNNLQLLLASVFLLHALYAIMLYIAKLRQPSLIWFALFVISFTLMVMVGSDEKQLTVWFGLSYTTGFRLVLLNLALMIFAFF